MHPCVCISMCIFIFTYIYKYRDLERYLYVDLLSPATFSTHESCLMSTMTHTHTHTHTHTKHGRLDLRYHKFVDYSTHEIMARTRDTNVKSDVRGVMSHTALQHGRLESWVREFVVNLTHELIARTRVEESFVLTHVYTHRCIYVYTHLYICMCVCIYIDTNSWYRVAKMHRMPSTAGLFPQKSH